MGVVSTWPAIRLRTWTSTCSSIKKRKVLRFGLALHCLALPCLPGSLIAGASLIGKSVSPSLGSELVPVTDRGWGVAAAAANHCAVHSLPRIQPPISSTTLHGFQVAPPRRFQFENCHFRCSADPVSSCLPMQATRLGTRLGTRPPLELNPNSYKSTAVELSVRNLRVSSDPTPKAFLHKNPPSKLRDYFRLARSSSHVLAVCHITLAMDSCRPVRRLSKME